MGKVQKSAKQIETVAVRKHPKSLESQQSFYDAYPVWSFSKLDCNYKKWGFQHTKHLYDNVITKLKANEGMTWAQIMSAPGGRTHGTNSHRVYVSELIPEAQKRWSELKLEEYDTAFSLRLAGEERLFGILLSGVFYIVWYDQHHEIYKLKK